MIKARRSFDLQTYLWSILVLHIFMAIPLQFVRGMPPAQEARAELQPGKAALLVIDVQKYSVEPGTGLLVSEEAQKKFKYFTDRVYDTLVPNTKKLLDACRRRKQSINVIYTYIECLTQDCRERSFLYKVLGFYLPKGSDDANFVDEIAPIQDEILLPKTASSVFSSTILEYILRNLGVTQLVVTGIITNQCVEGAVRDAADLGFYVTLVEDACAALSPEEHQSALHNIQGYSRIITHEKVVAEINGFANTPEVTSSSVTYDITLVPGESAILFIDLQEYWRMKDTGYPKQTKYMLERLAGTVLPNAQRLVKACRDKKEAMEVMYTFIESLKKDNSDQSLGYQMFGITVSKGCAGAKIMKEVAPEDDEILLPRTALSVFTSTNINYLLRNMGIRQIVLAGMITNQSIESTVRSAADRGFLVTIVEDACVAHSEDEHKMALQLLQVASRIVTTDQLVSELATWD